MAIPDYQTVMLPLLKLVAKHGKLKLKDARAMIADEFELTTQEKKALLPSGKQPIIYNRVGWASTYLRKALLVALPQRGVMEITERGKQVLACNPTMINVKFLEQFSEFLEFRAVNSAEERPKVTSEIEDASGTPKIVYASVF